MIKIYGLPGESLEVCSPLDLQSPYVPMPGPRPCVDAIAVEVDGKFVWQEPVKELPKFYGNDKLDLFSEGEQIAIISKTMEDPYVKRMYDRLLNASFVTYDDPEMEAGLSMLLSKGLLTQERKDEIVAKMHG